MRKYYRRIVFSKTPLKSQFRYKDRFQILPNDSENAPKSPYNKHFPLFLEYYIDFDDNQHPKGVCPVNITGKNGKRKAQQSFLSARKSFVPVRKS